MASFPAALWARFSARSNTTPNLNNQPNDHNAMADELVAIETELGIDPAGVFADVATRLDGVDRPPLLSQIGTAYTLALTDLGKVVNMSNAAAQTLTVPPESSVAWPQGIQIQIRQAGGGQVTISPGTGVTIRSRGNAFRLAGQYAWATLIKTGTNTWDLVGDLVV